MKVFGLIILLILTARSFAQSPVFTANELAIGGVDVVAYFTDGKPTMGDKQYSIVWEGVTWWFASAEHAGKFQNDPAQFAPQFGGYCSLTTAHGASIPSNPMAWTIYDDKLYLFVFESAKETWLMNPEQLIVRAKKKWLSKN